SSPVRILQLCKKFPFPARDGESIAILQMSKALSESGCEVSLLAMNTSRHYVDIAKDSLSELKYFKSIQTVDIDNAINWVDALKNIFSKDSYHISRFISDEFASTLENLLQREEFDIIQLETLYLAPFLPVIRRHSKALIVLRAHNIEHEIWQRIATQVKFLPKKWYLHYLSRKLKNFEVNTLNDYDFLVAITERDLVHFKSLGYKNGCFASPVGFDLSRYEAEYSAFQRPMALSFIGSLDWMPNIEALRWFLNEVWPTLHRKFPELEFHFAGRNAPPDLSALQMEAVFYHSDVLDARRFLLQYPILVVPLLAGSGIRVKILEAMALGRVVVTTSIGLEGIPARHKEQVFIANSTADFIESIQHCYDHYGRLSKIGENARSFVTQHFDSSKLAGKLVHAYKKALHSHGH
ncbi:MAG TPA: glycosyltransferase family 4 protein, partial [Saprospiraceae bacterium]|nr:glycosyltransferase family 4 protein [Saprospiraceae bacterium]